jgi:hypothetical protein
MALLVPPRMMVQRNDCMVGSPRAGDGSAVWGGVGEWVPELAHRRLGWPESTPGHPLDHWVQQPLIRSISFIRLKKAFLRRMNRIRQEQEDFILIWPGR